MRKPFVRVAFAMSCAVFIAGCSDKPADAPAAAVAARSMDANAPDSTLNKSVALLKAGDFAGLMQNSMPPAAYDKFKADWGKDNANKPVTDEDRKRFNETMGKLTAPDAENTLYAEVEPKLKQFDAQYQAQIPMYVTMGTGWLGGMIQQNKDMSDAEKQQAVASINALGAWAQKTHFTDPDSVKKVIAIGVKAARDVNLKTADEARALGFDQAMQKAKIVYVAVKNALDVYGFSIDKTLDSMKPEVVSIDGNNAKVKVAYTLLDSPMTVETDMVKVDDHWYGKNAIEKLKEKDAPPPATATPATAPPPPPPKQG